MDYCSERNSGCRVFEYFHRNLRMFSMENEILKVTFILDKGADVYELIYKPTDTDFMWKAPRGIRDPLKYIPSNANPEGNFLDYYEGGWQEVLPGGGPMQYKGASFGLHGEVCLLPWNLKVLKDAEDEIIVELDCRLVRIPFLVVKTVGLKSNSSVIDFHEKIINLSSEDIEFMWGHHPAVGKPFLNENCVINLPAEKYLAKGKSFCEGSLLAADSEGRWPQAVDCSGKKVDLRRVPKSDSKSADLLFLSGLEDGWFTFTDPVKKLGYGMKWDLNIFPYVWYWYVAGGSSGYPWYASTYNIALEIWSSMPSSFDEAKRRNTLRKLSGGESISTEYLFTVFSGLEKTSKVQSDGIVI